MIFLTDASFHNGDRNFAPGFTLGGQNISINNYLPDSVCAAGLMCDMIRNGSVPIASSRHRCPGRLQDFISCNKPIHAICGILIENPRNGDMFNKWCYDCATALQSQVVASVPRTIEDKEGVVRVAENQKGRGKFHLHPLPASPDICIVLQAANNNIQSSTPTSQSTNIHERT